VLRKYPSHLQSFIQQKIAAGECESVEDFAVKAACLYIDVDHRREELKARIAAAVDRVVAGESFDIEGDDELWDYREEINSEVSRRKNSG
jgi:hypothetical protein